MGYFQNALVKMGMAQPGPKITSHDRAVLDLKLQRDKMRQYQKRLQVVLDREQEIAREALKAGNKTRALTALRQKKYQEQLLAKTDSQLMTLQELVSTIEFTQIQTAVMHGLEVGAGVLKQLHSEMSLERVEKLMDQSREGIEYQREIDEALMSKMSPEEEDEVQAELERLQLEAMTSVPVQEAEQAQPIILPNVPNTEPVPTSAEGSTVQADKSSAREERVALAA